MLSSPIPRNDNFAKMYDNLQQSDKRSTTGFDMEFHLGREVLKCHQIVFTTGSDYFRKAVRCNNRANRRDFGDKVPLQVFYLDEWVSVPALHTYIRFMYTGEMVLDSTDSRSKGRQEQLLGLFRLGCFFMDSTFQEALVAQEIIPNMNSTMAVMFMQELIGQKPFGPAGDRPPAERPKAFLDDFCLMYLYKNLPLILRQDQSSISRLPNPLLFTIVRMSFEYIKDAKSDLDVVLDYAASVWGENDIFALFAQISDRWTACRGFDQQRIPNAHHIRDFKVIEDLCMDPLPEVDFDRMVSEVSLAGTASTDADGLGNPVLKAVNSVKRDRSATGVVKSDEPLNQNTSVEREKGAKPADNVYVVSDGQAGNTQAIKKPLCTFTIDMTEEEIKQRLDKKLGVTCISRAFDAARRSWHLKVDIDPVDRSISLWVLERGEPFCSKSLNG